MKNKPLSVNDKFLEIDKSYFDNYGGKGSYSNSYKSYTYPADQIVAELLTHNIMFETILDAGCATGELVKDFRNLGIKGYGIDNNRECISNSVCPTYCSYLDLKEIDTLKDNLFDVVYCNALMYLWPQEILPTLKKIRKVCGSAFYLCNPFMEEADLLHDPYRKFLASKKWWNKQLQEAGFIKVSSKIYKKN